MQRNIARVNVVLLKLGEYGRKGYESKPYLAYGQRQITGLENELNFR